MEPVAPDPSGRVGGMTILSMTTLAESPRAQLERHAHVPRDTALAQLQGTVIDPDVQGLGLYRELNVSGSSRSSTAGSGSSVPQRRTRRSNAAFVPFWTSGSPRVESSAGPSTSRCCQAATDSSLPPTNRTPPAHPSNISIGTPAMPARCCSVSTTSPRPEVGPVATTAGRPRTGVVGADAHLARRPSCQTPVTRSGSPQTLRSSSGLASIVITSAW